MSLLGLVPIFGFLCLYGWLLTTRDNLRAGRLQVPAATFAYWRRGVYFFFTFVFYSLGWLALAFLLFVVDLLLAKGGSHQVGPDAVGLFAALLLLVLAGLFLYTFGAILAIADARGIWATFNPSLVWRTASASNASWRFLGAYLLGFLALGALGLIPVFGTLAAFLLASSVYLMTAPALADIKVPATGS